MEEEDRHQRREVEHPESRHYLANWVEDGLRNLEEDLDQRVIGVEREPGQDRPEDDGDRQGCREPVRELLQDRDQVDD